MIKTAKRSEHCKGEGKNYDKDQNVAFVFLLVSECCDIAQVEAVEMSVMRR